MVLLSEYQTMNNIQHVPLPHLIIRDDFYFLILFLLKVIINFNKNIYEVNDSYYETYNTIHLINFTQKEVRQCYEKY